MTIDTATMIRDIHDVVVRQHRAAPHYIVRVRPRGIQLASWPASGSMRWTTKLSAATEFSTRATALPVLARLPRRRGERLELWRIGQ